MSSLNLKEMHCSILQIFFSHFFLTVRNSVYLFVSLRKLISVGPIVFLSVRLFHYLSISSIIRTVIDFVRHVYSIRS